MDSKPITGFAQNSICDRHALSTEDVWPSPKSIRTEHSITGSLCTTDATLCSAGLRVKMWMVKGFGGGSLRKPLVWQYCVHKQIIDLLNYINLPTNSLQNRSAHLPLPAYQPQICSFSYNVSTSAMQSRVTIRCTLTGLRHSCTYGCCNAPLGMLITQDLNVLLVQPAT